MAIKKTELYSSLWASCDNLRGGMDASQYKDYVLTLLFMKYVSDKYKDDPYGMIEVPEGASYDDMLALKGDKEIGDKLNKIIAALAEANDLKGVIDVADFNDEDKLARVFLWSMPAKALSRMAIKTAYERVIFIKWSMCLPNRPIYPNTAAW